MAVKNIQDRCRRVRGWLSLRGPHNFISLEAPKGQNLAVKCRLCKTLDHKVMSCDGGHLGFLIAKKNIEKHFLESYLRNIRTK